MNEDQVIKLEQSEIDNLIDFIRDIRDAGYERQRCQLWIQFLKELE
jgi:hypothetical protein